MQNMASGSCQCTLCCTALPLLQWNVAGRLRSRIAAAATEHEAAHGDSEAEYALAVMLLEGACGVPIDREEGAWLLQRAAAPRSPDATGGDDRPCHVDGRGHAKALVALGDLTRAGAAGVPRDDSAAVGLFSRAAAQGYPAARGALAYMLWAGRGIARDETRAVRLWRRAAARDDVPSLLNLGVAHETGRGGLKCDEHAAERCFRAAAARGDEYEAERAVFALGRIHEARRQRRLRELLPDYDPAAAKSAAEDQRRAAAAATARDGEGSSCGLLSFFFCQRPAAPSPLPAPGAPRAVWVGAM
jgi:TPR repeat protein